MSANKVLATPMVNLPADIEQSIQVNGDHMVALVVSQAEEQLIAREDGLRDQLKQLNGQKTDLKQKLKDGEENIKGSVLAECEKTLAPAFKKLGVNIGITITIDESGNCGINVFRKSSDKNVLSGPAMNFQRQMSVKSLEPTRKKIEEVEKQVKDVTSELARIVSFRQSGIAQLERWARGQLALNAMKSKGANIDEFMKHLVKGMPASFQRVLT